MRSRRKAFPEASRLITETWVHYANAGRIESVNEWLAHVPDDGDQRLLLAKAWVSALRGRELDMRTAAAKARALGHLGDGPLPDGFASVESSLGVLEATFGWGDVHRDPHERRALGEARAARLAVAARDHLGARLGALLQRRPRRGRALAEGDDRDRARGRAVDRRRRGDRRPVADRRDARAPRRAAAARRGGGRGLRDAPASSTRSRTARCTPPTASRWPRRAARRGAVLAREGRLPAPAVGAEARPDRRPDRAREHGGRAGRPRTRGRAAGRGAGPRRPLRRPGRAAGADRRGADGRCRRSAATSSASAS